MREILFKAKSIDKYEKGKWVEGYLFDDGYENGRIFVGNLEIQEYKGAACDNWDIVGTCFYEVDPSTVCQYTGLTDKNDEKINLLKVIIEITKEDLAKEAEGGNK